MTVMMNGVKHYVKYSIMNVLTAKEKSCLFAKERYIYMRWDVWDVWDVRDVVNVPEILNVLNVPERLPKLPSSNFGRRPAANLPCLNWGRNIFPLMSLFGRFFNAGYIISGSHHFSFWSVNFSLSWSTDAIGIVFLLLRLFLKKVFLLCFLARAVLQPTPTILKNRALSHQMMLSVFVV